jgi:hypothetical protein
MSTTPGTTNVTKSDSPAHITQKFRYLSEKLEEDNGTSWKRAILAVLRDRKLDAVTLGAETCPEATPARVGPSTRSSSSDPPPENVESITAWKEKSHIGYNQVLLNITSHPQPLIDHTKDAHTAWKVLLNFFEAKDASLNTCICSQYETTFYKDGDSIMAYIAQLADLRN